MLLNSFDFGVHSFVGAANTCKTDLACVSLEGSIHQCISLTSDIPGGFRVGEGLISSGLVQAFQICDGSSAGGSSSISEKTEDRIYDAGWVVEGKAYADTIEESVVGVFLRDFAVVKHGVWDGEYVLGLWHRSCRGQAK